MITRDDNPDLAQVGTESLVSWVEVTQAGVEAVAGEETQFGCRAAGGYPVPDIEVPISNYLTIYISTLYPGDWSWCAAGSAGGGRGGRLHPVGDLHRGHRGPGGSRHLHRAAGAVDMCRYV